MDSPVQQISAEALADLIVHFSEPYDLQYNPRWSEEWRVCCPFRRVTSRSGLLAFSKKLSTRKLLPVRLAGT